MLWQAEAWVVRLHLFVTSTLASLTQIENSTLSLPLPLPLPLSPSLSLSLSLSLPDQYTRVVC